MKTLAISEAKTHFSSVIDDVRSGEKIAISFGKQRETVAVIIPYDTWKNTQTRDLGTLEDRGSVEFADDWYMTDEELCNL
jgi:prevent-host-death family protein